MEPIREIVAEEKEGWLNIYRVQIISLRECKLEKFENTEITNAYKVLDKEGNCIGTMYFNGMHLVLCL